MRFVDGNHVVEQLAAATSYPSFRDTILPRAADGRPHGFDVHDVNCVENFSTVLGVVIEEKESG
jgi:hypothetical protein